MDVVDQVVAPYATGMLVEPHGPEADHLPLRIGIELSELAQARDRHAGDVGCLLQGVFGYEFCVLVEADIGAVVRLRAAGGLFLQWMIGAEAITDVGLAALEDGMVVDERLVDAPSRDDVVGDGVEDRKIGLRLEHDRNVGEVEGAVLERRQYRDLDMRGAKLA